MVKTRASKRKEIKDENVTVETLPSPTLQVSDPPSALTNSLGLPKIRSRKVAVRGKFIGNIESTVKSERNHLVTVEPSCTDKFLSNFNQTPAQEEPQIPSTLPSAPPQNPLVTVQPLPIDKFLSACTQTPPQEQPQFPSTLPAHPPHNMALQNCTLTNIVSRDFNPDRPTPAESLGITVMAAMVDNNSDEEVDSSESGLATVNGYKVKPEYAPDLRDIIYKHGDIADSCPMQAMRSFCLEMVCEIFQWLKNTKFKDLTTHKLQTALGWIDDLEKAGLRVGWLRKRVEDLNQAMAKLKDSSSLKLAKMKNKVALDEAVKAISILEEKVAELKAESEKIDSTARQTKNFVKRFFEKSLVDGLL